MADTPEAPTAQAYPISATEPLPLILTDASLTITTVRSSPASPTTSSCRRT